MAITSKHANAYQDPTSTSDAVRLPFPHLTLTWHNGNPAAPGGAYKFGGWYAENIHFERDMNSIGLATFDPTITKMFGKPQSWTNSKGGEYGTYSTRIVMAAPIASRQTWYKGRSIFSVLAMLAYTDEDKSLKSLFPAVLNAGGKGNSEDIRSAMKEWQSETAVWRNQFAAGVPLNEFYIPLGTYGDKRVARDVTGKGGKSSKVAVIRTFVPSLDDDAQIEAYLEQQHVGEEVADVMVGMLADAQEWLAWKPKKFEEKQVSNDPQDPNYDDDGGFPY